MKQFKVTLAVVALALGTVGVFAGKPAFVNGLYAKKGASTAVQIANSFNTLKLQTSVNGSQVTITDHTGAALPLYNSDALTTPLYEISTGF